MITTLGAGQGAPRDGRDREINIISSAGSLVGFTVSCWAPDLNSSRARRLVRHRTAPDPAAPESEPPAGNDKMIPEGRDRASAAIFESRAVFSGTGPRFGCRGWRAAPHRPRPAGSRRQRHIRRPGRRLFLPEQQSCYEGHFREPEHDLGLPPPGVSAVALSFPMTWGRTCVRFDAIRTYPRSSRAI